MGWGEGRGGGRGVMGGLVSPAEGRPRDAGRRLQTRTLAV